MIEAVLIEVPNPRHPFGARGVGEVPIVPPMAAIANAIRSATGLRMPDLPIIAAKAAGGDRCGRCAEAAGCGGVAEPPAGGVLLAVRVPVCLADRRWLVAACPSHQLLQAVATDSRHGGRTVVGHDAGEGDANGRAGCRYG